MAKDDKPKKIKGLLQNMAKIRQEINILVSQFVFSVVASNEQIQIDTAQYVNPTFYFEVVGKVTTSQQVTLRRVGTATDDASVTVNTVGYTRFRSTAFSPPVGKTKYNLAIVGAGTSGNAIAARVIVIDNGTITTSETQIEIGGNQAFTVTTAAALNSPKYWLYTAANWNGTKTFDAEVCFKTASTNTATITLQEDNGSYAAWADILTIVNAVSNTNPTLTRTSAHFVPTDGRHYRIAVKSSTTKSSVTLLCAKIVVNQSSSPTLLELQYLFLNANSVTTGLQSCQSLWDSTEWSGVTNTYKHALEGSGAEVGELDDIDNANTVLTNSNITITAGQQSISNAITMPTTGHQIDTNYKTKVTALWGSRILAIVSINSTFVSRLATLGAG